MENNIILHPEIANQLKELEALRAESSRLYLKAEYMQFEERPLLYSLYQTNIGQLEFEEFQMVCQIRLLILERNLLQSYINRDEEPDFEKIQARIDIEKREFDETIKEKSEDIKAAQDYLVAPCMSKEESDEIRNIYRIIAKSLHPDINSNLSEKEKELFIKAITAYRHGDLPILREIALMIAKEDIKDISDDELPSLIEKTKKAIQDFTIRIENMNSEFPFTYRDKLKDPLWIKEQKVELNQRITEAKERLEELTKYVSILRLWKKGSLN